LLKLFEEQIPQAWQEKRQYSLFKAGFGRCPKCSGTENHMDHFSLSVGNPFDHENMLSSLKALKRELIQRKYKSAGNLVHMPAASNKVDLPMSPHP
jgi:hypothetical protein